RDDTTWTFEPRRDASWPEDLPDEWHVMSKVDTSGNRVDWTWGGPTLSGDQVAQIEYGGTTPGDHFLRVRFVWRQGLHQSWRASAGVISDTSDRLARIVVETKYGRAAYASRHTYELRYD